MKDSTVALNELYEEEETSRNVHKPQFFLILGISIEKNSYFRFTYTPIISFYQSHDSALRFGEHF